LHKSILEALPEFLGILFTLGRSNEALNLDFKIGNFNKGIPPYRFKSRSDFCTIVTAEPLLQSNQ